MSVSPADLRTVMEETFKDLSSEAFTAYPVDDSLENAIGISNEMSLDAILANVHTTAWLKQKTDPAHKTFTYNFSRIIPDTEERMARCGAFHTGDVGYWLNYFSDSSNRPWSETDYELGDVMSGYLVNFAKTGDPNGDGLPEWKAIDASEDVSWLDLGDTVKEEKMTAEKSVLWNHYFQNMIEN